jgi:hypothetical protein
MRIKKGFRIYVRLAVTGFAVLFGLLTVIASGPNMVWVKRGSTQQDFNQDKYACMQQSQQPYYDRAGAYSSSGVNTNMNLYNSCMEARGWSLQRQDR